MSDLDELQHQHELELTAIRLDRDVCRDIAERERRRAEKAEAERDQQQDETLREHARAKAVEQERDNLRAHVDADHQVLAQVRHHAGRLREWCWDEHATVTIAGSIIADLQKTLNGEGTESE